MLTKNDLLVLGMLLDRPMHGYEIGQQIRSEGVPTWFDISTAAIYYSLNKLRKLGLISETRSRSGGAEKSVYHLTERGRSEFFSGMEETLASEEPVRFEYDLGIYLLNKLSQERAQELLTRRLGFLRGWDAALEEALLQERANGGQPLKVAILSHSLACARMELEWLSGILRHLRGEGPEVEDYQGLMILTGDLRDFHLPDLIKLIVSGKHSGTLTVTDGTSTRALTFVEGRPTCATSTHPSGEARELAQVMDDIYDLFRWQDGAFTFNQRVGAQESCLVLRLSAEALILAGSRWVDNWATIQRAVPSPEMVFERREGGTRPDELDLTADEQRVLELVDGLRDVMEIAMTSQLTEFETSKILYSFYTVGLVQPGDLDKIRLRRVFREFAELMCKSTTPYRQAPNDLACELEVNRRCANLPIRFTSNRIEDQTDPALPTEELVHVYRNFLHTQRTVVQECFGEDVARRLRREVFSRLSPGLREALEQYDLV